MHPTPADGLYVLVPCVAVLVEGVCRLSGIVALAFRLGDCDINLCSLVVVVFIAL